MNMYVLNVCKSSATKKHNLRRDSLPTAAILWIFLNILTLFWVVRAEDNSDFIESVAQHLNAKSVVLISEQEKGITYELMTTHKKLNHLMKFYTLVVNFRELQENMLVLGNGKVLVVVHMSLNTLNSFIAVSKTMALYKVNWLWISSSTELDVGMFKDVYITFHTNFLYAFRENENIIIQEIYQATKNSPKKVNNFGKWNKTNGLTTVEGEFYNRRRDLSGVTLRNLINEGRDFCDLSFEENPTVLPCLFLDTWRDLEYVFNFTTKYVTELTKDIVRLSQFIVTKLQKHEVDACSYPFVMSSRRLKENNFLWPIMMTSFFVYTKVPDSEINFSSYLQPLSFNLWLAVLTWMLTMAITMTFIKWIIIRMMTNRNFVFLRDAVDDSATSFSALCAQSTSLTFGEELLTVRILILMTHIVSLFVLPSYSGGLISSLSNPPVRLPFSNIHEFAENGEYKIITMRESFVAHILETESLMAGVREKNLIELEGPFPGGDAEAFDMICRRPLSYFIDEPVFLLGRPPCKLFIMNQIFGVVPGALAVAKDFPFTELFTRIMQKYHFAGLTFKRLEKITMNGLQVEFVLKTAESYKAVVHDPQFEHTKVFALKDVFSIFVVIIAGYVLSIFVLLMEKVYYRRKGILRAVPQRYKLRSRL